MKLLRVWLLVLLAALLPVRGAMAVAMACAPGNMPVSGAAAVSMAHADHHGHGASAHDHASSGHHDHGAHGHAPVPAGTPDDGTSHADQCNLCAASCSATPLIRDVAGIPEPADAAATTFPSLSAPAPSFLSDGQERPPRSL